MANGDTMVGELLLASANDAGVQVKVGDGTLWEQLEQQTTKYGVFKPTVNDVASDIKLGSVDAGTVWDATVRMPTFRDDLRAISAPELEGEADLEWQGIS